jgi:hypothetical protein
VDRGSHLRGRSKMGPSLEKVEARAVIRFLHLHGKSDMEIHDQMTAMYQEVVTSYNTVVTLKRRFHCGQSSEMNLEVEDHISLKNREFWHRWKLRFYPIDA